MVNKLHWLNQNQSQIQPKVTLITFSEKRKNKLHLIVLVANRIFKIFFEDDKIAKQFRKKIVFLVISLYFIVKYLY